MSDPRDAQPEESDRLAAAVEHPVEDGTGELYRRLILQHNQNSPYASIPAKADRRCQGHNALCGDRLQIGLQLEHGQIRSIGFEADASAVVVASASMWCALLAGQKAALVDELDADFRRLLRGPSGQHEPSLGELNVLSALRGYPSRVRSALLPLEAIQGALQGRPQASSEGSGAA